MKKKTTLTTLATFIISITISEFGNLAKFYKTYAKGNREIIVDGIEYEGTDEQHNTGLLIDKLVCTVEDKKNFHSVLTAKVKEFLDKNSLHQECFAITLEGSKKVLFTEEDF